MIGWNMSPGIAGFDWVLIAIGIVFDISSYSGSGYGNRGRFLRG